MANESNLWNNNLWLVRDEVFLLQIGIVLEAVFLKTKWLCIDIANVAQSAC